MSLLIGVLTFILILVSVFLVLVVLMQRAKSDGGVGAALGGGMTESTFGAETGNVLTKATINGAVVFFVLSFVLYLAHIYQRNHAADGASALPKVPAALSVPASATAPSTTTAAEQAPLTVPSSAAPTTTTSAAASSTPAAAPAASTPTAAQPAAAPSGGEKKP